jgi:hypothetical protein
VLCFDLAAAAGVAMRISADFRKEIEVGGRPAPLNG